jgi:hydroxyethylthiazole kinase-like uncharacterized protein yjeF
MSVAHLQHLLRSPNADDNKYTRGVVGFVTGSEDYPGAALLGANAAARTGIGMLRYLGPDSVNRLIIESRPETVLGFGRVDAWVLGSGIAVDNLDQQENLKRALADDKRKVIDAGALTSTDYVQLESLTAILTPHAGELARLLDHFGRHFELDFEAVKAAAAMTRQVVVLKGNTSLIAHPSGEVVAVGPNSTALATAGTGDVLAGIMGAILAANPDGDLVEIAELAVTIHSEAAARAAMAGPVVAMDVVDELRTVIKGWQQS